MTLSGTLSDYNLGPVGLIDMMGGLKKIAANARNHNDVKKDQDTKTKEIGDYFPKLPTAMHDDRRKNDLASILEEATKIVLDEEELSEAHQQQERERREARERREREIIDLADAARKVALEPKTKISSSPAMRIHRRNSIPTARKTSSPSRAMAA